MTTTCETCLAEIQRAAADELLYGRGCYILPHLDANGDHIHARCVNMAPPEPFLDAPNSAA